MNNEQTKADILNIQDSIINAGKAIGTAIERDEVFTDLADLLQGPTLNSYVKPLYNPESEFKKTIDLEMPAALRNEITDTTCRLFTGVLPEINRAWVTIDNRLYMWNYHNPTDIFQYDDQDQVILTLGLVKPKPDIFGDHINYLLVIPTTVQVIILAVSCPPAKTQEEKINSKLNVYATDLTIPSDEFAVEKVVGTDSGRIFLLSTTNVYEFNYQAPASRIFSSNSSIRCLTGNGFSKYLPTAFMRKNEQTVLKAAVVDNERKTLYLLGADSSIEVIYLGNDTNPCYQSIFKYTKVIQDASQMCRLQTAVADTSDFIIQSLHIISSVESKKVHLMAVTSGGYRLYFTHHRDGFRSFRLTPADDKPNTLELGHIRIPPKNEPAPGQMKACYKLSYHYCGITMLCTQKSESLDQVVMTTVTPPKKTSVLPSTNGIVSNSMNSLMNVATRPQLIEVDTNAELDKRILAIEEADKLPVGSQKMNELAEQRSSPNREFIMLTMNGLTVYSKQRPVDILYFMLENAHGHLETKKKEFIEFIDRFERPESCAMCLSIVDAISSRANISDREKEVLTSATKLFFEYGGRPMLDQPSQAPSNHLGRVIPELGSNIKYSGAHDGLVLHFSRIVTPIWRLKFFAECNKEKMTEKDRTALGRKLSKIENHLWNLRRFMEQNMNSRNTPAITDPRYQPDDGSALQLQLREQRALRGIFELLVRCIQVIQFMHMFLESDFLIIMNFVEEKAKPGILELNMDKMLVSPEVKPLIQELTIAAIYKCEITPTNVKYDTITYTLEAKCGSFFGPKELNFYKGIECLKYTKILENEQDRNAFFAESLKHFKLTADDISEEKLAIICSIYRANNFHLGVVELALERANRQDPQKQGLAYFESNKAAEPGKSHFFDLRVRSYHYVFEALMEAKTKKQIPSLAKNAFAAAFASDDELFHYQLYYWMLNKDMMNDLLSADTVYLIPYFEKHVTEQGALEFLWQYSRRKRQFFKASKYLYNLASFRASIPMASRIEWLACANVNCRCHDPKVENAAETGAFLQELQSALKAATLQQKIQNALKSENTIESNTEAAGLDMCLLTLPQLREKYPQFVDYF
ncbi:nucleoporin-domain-containing protein [Backusella circina FSU 941]|nr:nucleoporin-domain-containing protein [Backusella circina FSU 941]